MANFLQQDKEMVTSHGWDTEATWRLLCTCTWWFEWLNILKHFKTQHLIQCQFLPEDQIIPVIDNEMDKSDQLACIRYKNQNILA